MQSSWNPITDRLWFQFHFQFPFGTYTDLAERTFYPRVCTSFLNSPSKKFGKYYAIVFSMYIINNNFMGDDSKRSKDIVTSFSEEDKQRFSITAAVDNCHRETPRSFSTFCRPGTPCLREDSDNGLIWSFQEIQNTILEEGFYVVKNQEIYLSKNDASKFYIEHQGSPRILVTLVAKWFNL